MVRNRIFPHFVAIDFRIVASSIEHYNVLDWIPRRSAAAQCYKFVNLSIRERPRRNFFINLELNSRWLFCVRRSFSRRKSYHEWMCRHKRTRCVLRRQIIKAMRRWKRAALHTIKVGNGATRITSTIGLAEIRASVSAAKSVSVLR